jgi:choice-of-anchor A domain-containing protein
MTKGLVEEGIFVGNVFNAPPYLKMRWEGYSPVIGDQDAAFETARAYYQSVSDKFANQFTDNANATVKWGGLFVHCYSNTATRYILTIDGAVMSSITWYNFANCNFPADWVINIVGSGPVSFQGQQLPAIIERAIFNVRGSGRLISVYTGLAGNLLAPNNDLYMANSVTRGLVAVRNVLKSVQNNRPYCTNFESVKVNTVAAGSPTNNSLPVASVATFQPGDSVTVNGGSAPKRQATYILESITQSAQTGTIYFNFDQEVDSTFGQGAFLTTSVDDPASQVRSAVTPNMTTESSSMIVSSSSSEDALPTDFLVDSAATLPVVGVFALVAALLF